MSVTNVCACKWYFSTNILFNIHDWLQTRAQKITNILYQSRDYECIPQFCCSRRSKQSLATSTLANTFVLFAQRTAHRIMRIFLTIPYICFRRSLLTTPQFKRRLVGEWAIWKKYPNIQIAIFLFGIKNLVIKNLLNCSSLVTDEYIIH